MENNPIMQAANLFKAGDKQKASEILISFLDENPGNAEAWYGLAICADNNEKKISYLEKVLSINPEHAAAKRSLEKFHMKGINMKKSIYFLFLLILLLFGSNIYLFYRLDKMEKTIQTTIVNQSPSTTKMEQDIEALQGNVVSLDSKISGLASTMDSNFSYIQGIINQHANMLNQLAGYIR